MGLAENENKNITLNKKLKRSDIVIIHAARIEPDPHGMFGTKRLDFPNAVDTA